MRAPFAFEPETATFVRSVEQGPPTEGLSISALRDGYRATVIANSVEPDSGVTTRDLAIPGETGEIAARLYVPESSREGGGLLIYVHGGGFAVGDLDSHDRLVRLIAAASRLTVLCLDYPLAPEHPFPAARDAVITAFEWTRANAASLGVDAARIALGGESAGATHVIMATLALVRSGGEMPALVWALVPATDPAGSTASHRDFANGAGRTAQEFAYLWSLYLPDEAQRSDPAIVPALADLAGMPALLIHTAEYDPARDDGEQLAQRAHAAGVSVTLTRHAGLVHQFPEITGISSASREAIVQAARELADALTKG